jgi:hypothetical protein
MRAARKALPWPRRLGLGLCYEHAEVDPDAASKGLALCRRIGYHGAFEAELIRRAGGLLLIDFNPRFYGQMSFDIARGSPLPLGLLRGHRRSGRPRTGGARDGGVAAERPASSRRRCAPTAALSFACSIWARQQSIWARRSQSEHGLSPIP